MTVFLEFYGVPGCGKSTVSHLVAEEIRKRKKEVCEPTYESDHNYSAIKRKAIKFLSLILFAAFRPRKYKQLRTLIIDNGYRRLDLISQAANIVPKLRVYEKSRSDYVIFDEGLTQSSISLCKGKRESAENETDLFDLCDNIKTVYKIYMKVDVDTAIARMSKRERHDSRIEKLKNEADQRKEIELFNQQCEQIDGDIISVDASKEIEVLKDCVINALAGKGI